MANSRKEQADFKHGGGYATIFWELSNQSDFFLISFVTASNAWFVISKPPVYRGTVVVSIDVRQQAALYRTRKLARR